MPNDASNIGFQSVLAPFMDRFLQEKHTCGYAYHEPIRILHRFDEFLVREGLATLELPRSVVRNWLAKKPHESAATQQHRITIVRQFTKFLLKAGYQIKDSCRARFSAAAKSGVELNPRDDVEVWDFNATLLGVRWNQGGLKFWIGVDGQRTGNESERIRVDKFRKGLGTRQGNTRVDERAMSSARMGASFGRARG